MQSCTQKKKRRRKAKGHGDGHGCPHRLSLPFCFCCVLGNSLSYPQRTARRRTASTENGGWRPSSRGNGNVGARADPAIRAALLSDVVFSCCRGVFGEVPNVGIQASRHRSIREARARFRHRADAAPHFASLLRAAVQWSGRRA